MILLAMAFYGAIALALGFLVGRWIIVVASAAAFPLYVVGVEAAWWGHGLGDGWQPLLVGSTVAATMGSAAGVALRNARRQRAKQ